MNAAVEKSTACARVADEVILDGRLAIFHEGERWLAVSDVHFGYEVARRMEGGLYPIWGMETIESRLDGLIREYAPETLILNGDIVDNRSAGEEACKWLERLGDEVSNLVLVQGNHDRGKVCRQFEFSPSFETESFFFHHGHRSPEVPAAKTEVVGHLHPSVSFGDGAGTRLRLPSLVQEKRESGDRWVLPAFSPWAGGGKFERSESTTVTEWVCSEQRVFPVDVAD